MGDFDQNGIIDISIKYISGTPGWTGKPDWIDEELLEQASGMLGMTMSGCGYQIDKVIADLRCNRYVANFSECAACAWSQEKENEDDCFIKVWKKL